MHATTLPAQGSFRSTGPAESSGSNGAQFGVRTCELSRRRVFPTEPDKEEMLYPVLAPHHELDDAYVLAGGLALEPTVNL